MRQSVSIPNARPLGRLYDKIGLPETRVVPTIVIGHHVIASLNQSWRLLHAGPGKL